MNRIYFLLLLLTASCLRADESDEPHFHFFAVPSPSNTCVAVHTVRPWAGYENITQYGRLQILRSDTGAELWRLDNGLFYASEVFPADDQKHLIIIRHDYPTRQADTVAVVQFYREQKLLRSYTLRELGIDVSKLKKSVSHTQFTRTIHAKNNWSWEYPLNHPSAPILQLGSENPTWHGTVIELETLDGQTLRFDFVTATFLGPKTPTAQ